MDGNTTRGSSNNEYEYFSVSVRKVRVISRRASSTSVEGEEGDINANEGKGGISGDGNGHGNDDAAITNGAVVDGSVVGDGNKKGNGNGNRGGNNILPLGDNKDMEEERQNNDENNSNEDDSKKNSIPSPQDRTIIGVQEDIFYPVRVTFCTPMFELKSYVIAVIPESEAVAVAVAADTTMDEENQKQKEDKEGCGRRVYINAVKRALDIYGFPQDKITNNTVIIRGGYSRNSTEDDVYSSPSSGVGREDNKKEAALSATTTPTKRATIIPQTEYCILDRLDRIVMNALRRLSTTATATAAAATATTTTSGSSSNDVSSAIRDLLFRQRQDEGADEDETRTTSVHTISSSSSYQLFPSIRAYANLKRTAETATTDTMLTTQILRMLAPFHNAIRTLLEDNYPTIGLSITILRRIRDVLKQQQQEHEQDVNQDHDQKMIATGIVTKKEQIDDLLQTFNESIRHDFLNTLASILDGTPPSMAWTMPLDPRLVTMSSLSDQEQNVSKLKLIDEVQKIAVFIDQKEQREREPEKESGTSNDGTISAGNEKSGNGSSSSTSSFTMGGIFWDLPGNATTTTATTTRNNVNNCEYYYAKKNVESYFNTVQSQRRIKDPLLWWKNNQEQFPELAILARKWIFSCASSSSSSSVYGVRRDETRDNEYDDDIVMMISSSAARTSSTSPNNNNSDTTTTCMSRMIFLHDNIDLI
jgi:hypothetical protein